jgi:hypothetical protein
MGQGQSYIDFDFITKHTHFTNHDILAYLTSTAQVEADLYC